MDRIVALLLDPIFWFATIFIGLLLSVVANFATDSIRQFLKRFSAKQRERDQELQEGFEMHVKGCIADPSVLVVVTARMISYQISRDKYRTWEQISFTVSFLGMSVIMWMFPDRNLLDSASTLGVVRYGLAMALLATSVLFLAIAVGSALAHTRADVNYTDYKQVVDRAEVLLLFRYTLSVDNGKQKTNSQQ